jgi:hypothetical protein
MPVSDSTLLVLEHPSESNTSLEADELSMLGVCEPRLAYRLCLSTPWSKVSIELFSATTARLSLASTAFFVAFTAFS